MADLRYESHCLRTRTLSSSMSRPNQDHQLVGFVCPLPLSDPLPDPPWPLLDGMPSGPGALTHTLCRCPKGDARIVSNSTSFSPRSYILVVSDIDTFCTCM